MVAFLPFVLASATSTASTETVDFPIATAPSAPIYTGEVHTLPYLVDFNTTRCNQSVVDHSGAPPPPHGEGELPIFPDASLVPRAVELIGANLSGSNGTQQASNNGSELHSSASGRALFVFMTVAGVALVVGLAYGATRAMIMRRRNKVERAVERALELQRWPGAHSHA